MCLSDFGIRVMLTSYNELANILSYFVGVLFVCFCFGRFCEMLVLILSKVFGRNHW